MAGTGEDTIVLPSFRSTLTILPPKAFLTAEIEATFYYMDSGYMSKSVDLPNGVDLTTKQLNRLEKVIWECGGGFHDGVSAISSEPRWIMRQGNVRLLFESLVRKMMENQKRIRAFPEALREVERKLDAKAKQSPESASPCLSAEILQ